VSVDDVMIKNSVGQNSNTSFNNEMDFYFSIINKAFQKVTITEDILLTKLVEASWNKN